MVPVALFQSPVAEAIYQYTVLTLIFLWIASVLYCIFTVHRSPYFTEVQKLKWLLFILILPYFGVLAWFLRVRQEKKDAAARTSPTPSDTPAAASEDSSPQGSSPQDAAATDISGTLGDAGA